MAAMSQKRSCGDVMADLKEFIWNPRTREFMGRTGSSWALIITFYLVFYAFLTAVFCLSMWVMLQTLDDYFPTYADRLANPGLMIRPKTEGLQIVFSNESSSWQPYVQALDTVLNDYNDSVQLQRGFTCTNGTYNIQDDNGDVRNFPKKACPFLRSSLGACDGLTDPTYGYSKGTPCVLIKMNRVIKFLPGIIPSLSNTTITVNCSATTAANNGPLGNMTYYPGNKAFGSIDLKYFPYYGDRAQGNYSQPLVAVQFLNPTPNTAFSVQCQVNSANINSNDDRDKFAGRVIFNLRFNK
ncbi:sodium/potassium-transporting ATPase subunit beta-2-like isoform X2 [Pelobates fuscus]|uniref:sodium/potassium-transporting ATPase subunit beta-2-like isoform X2 n=1 Tax=Pelobates fuscus TaxID=191477 RepID=UPI002FE44EAF